MKNEGINHHTYECIVSWGGFVKKKSFTDSGGGVFCVWKRKGSLREPKREKDFLAIALKKIFFSIRDLKRL